MTLETLGMIGTQHRSEIHSDDGGPAIDPRYVRRVVRAHENSGFDRVLIGYSSSRPEGTQVAAYAAAHSERLKFLIAHRPGFVFPTVAARTFATLDRFSGGRIAVHAISGGSDADQLRDGDRSTKEQRYARTREFLQIVKRAWTETEPFGYSGESYRFEDFLSHVRPVQQPRIPVYFGGSSEASRAVGAAEADVYMLFGQPPAGVGAAGRRERVIAPFLAAQMAGTFQNLSRGRLLLNVVTGGESHEQRMYRDFLDKEDRCGEFLNVVRALWSGDRADFAGRYYRLEAAVLGQRPSPVPKIYFGGSSPAALDVAAKYVDVYLTWGEPPAAVAAKLDRLRVLADKQGHELTYGIRLHAIARDSEEEAWAEANRLLTGISPEQIRRIQASLQRSESEGQKRMLALNGGTKNDLQIYPSLWAGVGRVRGGAGTALVGSHQQIANLIEQYASVGISEFVLSGYPHREEAYRFGEGVLPELARRGLGQHPAPDHSSTVAVPFGGNVLQEAHS